jgi:hypothetical protein
MDMKTISAAARPPRTRTRTSPALLQWVRRLHLYSGVLFAPAILFFALTGVAQVYGLHKANPATGYQPPALLVRLGALHKSQTFALPHQDEAQKDGAKALVPAGGHHAKKAKAAVGDAVASPMTSPAEAVKAPAAKPMSPKPMSLGQMLLKAFVTAATLGLVSATLLGLYMAWAFNRNPWLVGGLLAAGVAIPLILIVGLGA